MAMAMLLGILAGGGLLAVRWIVLRSLVAAAALLALWIGGLIYFLATGAEAELDGQSFGVVLVGPTLVGGLIGAWLGWRRRRASAVDRREAEMRP